MKSIPKAFGLTVRELRTEKGLSQEGFAAMAGISRTYMSEIERGTTLVSLESILKVAKGLGVPPSVLVGHFEKALAAPAAKRGA